MKPRPLRYKTLLNFSLISVLTIGCFYQIYTICEMFFKYPTNVLIDTKFDAIERPLPAISFCSTYTNLILGVNTGDIFNHIQYKKMISFRIISESNHFEVRQNLSSFIWNHSLESLSANFYCLTINSLMKASKVISISPEEHLELIVNKFIWNDTWWLYLHDPRYGVSSNEWNAIAVQRSYYYSVTYSYQSFHLLERPYSTDCIDYKLSTEYDSRRDCIGKCKLKRGLDLCGVVPTGVEVIRGEPDVWFPNSTSERNCIENLNLSQNCLNVCPNVDCEKSYYRAVKTTQIYKDNDTQHLWLFLIPPSEPETTFVHKARIETVEFVCYIASTVGLWFGLSMFSTMTWINSLVFKFKQVINVNVPKVQVKRVPRSKVTGLPRK